MSTEILSLTTDFVIIVLLGVTIYYALRLSKSLNSFKSFKNDFAALINDLNGHIVRAETAIQNLKAATGGVDENVRNVLNESRDVLDELQIINKAGNRLAQRLEEVMENSNAAVSSNVVDKKDYDEALFENIERLDKKMKDVDDEADGAPSFFIQDRDFDSVDTEGQEFLSEAEKELYEALMESER